MSDKEPFTERLKAELAQGQRKIKIREQIRDIAYAELAMTSLNGSPLHPNQPISTVNFRFQTLISGAIAFSEGRYRLDNSHGELHIHFQESVSPVPISTLNDSCLMMCGSGW